MCVFCNSSCAGFKFDIKIENCIYMTNITCCCDSLIKATIDGLSNPSAVYDTVTGQQRTEVNVTPCNVVFYRDVRRYVVTSCGVIVPALQDTPPCQAEDEGSVFDFKVNFFVRLSFPISDYC